MEKIQLKFSKKSNIPITFFGTEISVNPIIRIDEQQTLRNIYIESLFREGRDKQWDEQFAEFMFRRGILGLKTNIDIDSIKEIEEIDELIWGEFYEKIIDTISNYYDVHNGVVLSMENEIRRMEIENNIGSIISGILEKVKPIIDTLTNMKPEDFEKMKTEANELIEKTKSEPIASVLADMKGNIPNKRKSKKG